jgi:hypothetical protein
MEVKMRNAKWLLLAGLAVLAAGCVEDGRYPNTAYRYNSGGYYNGGGYNSGGYWNSPRRDYDRDGIPNRYDRDANGDGIPDRYQGRYPARY